jgi:hypothetical protein
VPQIVRAHALVEGSGVGIGEDGHAPRALSTGQADGGIEQRTAGAAADRRRIDEQGVEIRRLAFGQHAGHADHAACVIGGDQHAAGGDVVLAHGQRHRAQFHERGVVAPVRLRPHAEGAEALAFTWLGRADLHWQTHSALHYPSGS